MGGGAAQHTMDIQNDVPKFNEGNPILSYLWGGSRDST